MQKWLGFSSVVLCACLLPLAGAFFGLPSLWLGLLFAATCLLCIELCRRTYGVEQSRLRRLDTSNEKEAQIHEIVKKIAQRAGIGVPVIKILDAETTHITLRATAIGFPFQNEICLSSELVTVFQHGFGAGAFESLIAHEITHLKQYDTALVFLLTLLKTSMLIFGALSAGATLMLAFTGFISLAAASLGFTLWLGVSSLMTELSFAAFSRAKESLADLGAVDLTQNPQATQQYFYDMFLQHLYWGKLVSENQWGGFQGYIIEEEALKDRLKELHNALSTDSYRDIFALVKGFADEAQHDSQPTLITQAKHYSLTWFNTHPLLDERRENIAASYPIPRSQITASA